MRGSAYMVMYRVLRWFVFPAVRRESPVPCDLCFSSCSQISRPSRDPDKKPSHMSGFVSFISRLMFTCSVEQELMVALRLPRV